MEVGAVKQAFNNEIILLKKSLNQAKTQTIHKLTRKAKTLTDKKAPDAIKEKFNKKAESAVKEVLIIKKIKPKDIAQFIVTHKGTLNEFMNRPLNNDKACARLLLHKSMQQKYKQIREKFSNISIKDLFMSRQERLKLKKEARDKQNNKKKGKDKTVNVEGEWDVEMTETNKKSNDSMKVHDLSEDDNAFNDKSESDVHSNNDLDNESDKSDDDNDNEDETDNDNDVESHNDNDEEIKQDNDEENEVSDEEETSAKSISTSVKVSNKVNKEENNIKISKKVKIDKKPKENKNRNLKEKLQKRNFNKDSIDSPLKASKIADPFFITSSGQNYMSLVEPRQPDEVKEVHKQGNRQHRRAVMFGHVPKSRPRKNYDRQTNFVKENQWNASKFEEKRNKFDRNNKDLPKDEIPEKLHPSWEAKKKQSSILPFQGKKIVFNEG